MNPGDIVQTPYGKGLVREVRNGDRVLVEVHGRALEMKTGDLSRLSPERKKPRGGLAGSIQATVARASQKRSLALAHSLENGLPDLHEPERAGPLIDVGRVNLAATRRQDTRDVPKVLVRTTREEEFHLLQDGVLGR